MPSTTAAATRSRAPARHPGKLPTGIEGFDAMSGGGLPHHRQRSEFDYKQRELRFAEANTSAQIRALQMDLERQRAELALYSGEHEVRDASLSRQKDELRKRRSADAAGNPSPKSGNGAAKSANGNGASK